jgi:hypothetical protein
VRIRQQKTSKNHYLLASQENEKNCEKVIMWHPISIVAALEQRPIWKLKSVSRTCTNAVWPEKLTEPSWLKSLMDTASAFQVETTRKGFPMR